MSEIRAVSTLPSCQANKDVESWETGTVGAGERTQKSLERMADMLIKINDKSRSAGMERLTRGSRFET
jgi:hypothetical protein